MPAFIQGRWWCAVCRVLWQGFRPAHEPTVVHACGRVMVAVSSWADVEQTSDEDAE